jgi:2,4-dichlorophenol 6-monooxygenase
VPCARPGARLPHAWIIVDGVRCSTLDRIPHDRFTLICGPDGAAWERSAASLTSPPIRALLIGRDFEDPDGSWARMLGLEGDGALLVRPDQHVAWRAARAPADVPGTLRAALGAILGG